MKDEEIDESLYSRQLFTLGKEAMKQIRNKKILISGMTGLGLEIAKNVILTGVHQVSLHDDDKVSYYDLASMFYCSTEDVGKNRAEAVLDHLCELNEYVKVKLHEGKLTETAINEYDVIVVCDAKSNDELLDINKWCRNNNRIFILANTKGLFGMIFCDFGEEFEVRDVSGTVPELHEISWIEKDSDNGLVHVKGDKGHGFCDESIVQFFDVQGMKELNDREPFQIEVKDWKSFLIGDNTQYGDHIPNTGFVKEIMLPKKMKFKPLSEFQSNIPKFDEISISDYSKMTRPSTVHLCFQAINDYYKKYGQYPAPWSVIDGEKFVEIVKELEENLKVKLKQPIDYEIVKLFAYGCQSKLNPMHASIGGIVAQEVLKASSQQFTPIQQFYYSDFIECLPNDWEDRMKNCGDQFVPKQSRYDSQIILFGRDFQQKLADSNVFVIGAGAIGCEMMKNLAMLGVCCQGNGRITLTDMDHIERSNLNRQFLFRSWNIGHPKSAVAANVVQKMNCDIKIDVHENRLGNETEQVYTNKFFRNLTCVLNALDNVEARQYAASRIEFNSTPMIDSGTMGPQASQQVIIPGLTKSYRGQQRNDDAIPICTIKNFPYQIEHTIQWAKDLFFTNFTTIPKLAALLIENKKEFEEHLAKLNNYQKFETVTQLLGFFQTIPTNFDDCITWAMAEWDKYFLKNIQQILYSFPENHLTTEGLPFWSGNKRVPKMEHFSLQKTHHADFVLFTSKLRSRLFKIPIDKSNAAILEKAGEYKFEKFIPSCEKIATEDEELEKFLDQELLRKRTNELLELKISSEIKMDPQEFEKDDDSNFHIDFITAASNMRAFNYSIPQADRFKTKKIAGRIIPAIVTSTSVITAQVCLEFIKVVQKHNEIRKFRDSFLNLASPVFTMTIPEKPQKFEVLGKSYSIWDKLDVEGDVTLNEFIQIMKDKYSMEIISLNYKTGVLYANWFDEEYMADNMKRKITNIIKEKLKLPLPDVEDSLSLTIGLDDEKGEDIEVCPEVRYRF